MAFLNCTCPAFSLTPYTTLNTCIHNFSCIPILYSRVEKGELLGRGFVHYCIGLLVAVLLRLNNVVVSFYPIKILGYYLTAVIHKRLWKYLRLTKEDSLIPFS